MAEFTGVQKKAPLDGGIYRHPVTGAELIAIRTEKFGNPQADAYVRLGYEYIGPAPTKDIENILDPHAKALVTGPADTAQDVSVKSVKELEVELAEAKKREAAQAKEAKKSEAEAKEVEKESK